MRQKTKTRGSLTWLIKNKLPFNFAKAVDDPCLHTDISIHT